MQSRTESLIETGVNIFIGMWISWASNYIVFPLVGLPLPSATVLWEMTAWFTVISIIRQYTIRRFFNGGFHMRKT